MHSYCFGKGIKHFITFLYILLMTLLLFPAFAYSGDILITGSHDTTVLSKGKKLTLPALIKNNMEIILKSGAAIVFYRGNKEKLLSKRFVLSGKNPLRVVIPTSSEPTDFLSLALNILKHGNTNIHYGGDKASESSFYYPNLPYDDIYFDRNGLEIQSRQIKIEGSGSNLRRQKFELDKLWITEVDSGSKFLFKANQDSRINIPAVNLKYDTDYTWTATINGKQKTGSFSTLEQSENQYIASTLHELNSQLNPETSNLEYRILLASIFEDSGCSFQGRMNIESARTNKGDKQ